jgi:hypothetical protein
VPHPSHLFREGWEEQRSAISDTVAVAFAVVLVLLFVALPLFSKNSPKNACQPPNSFNPPHKKSTKQAGSTAYAPKNKSGKSEI